MKTTVKSVILISSAALIAVALFTLSASLQSCKKDSNTTTTMTLYDSLGGTTMVQDPNASSGTMIEKGRLGIRSVVDSTIFIVAADNRLNGFFSVLLAEVTNGNTSGLTALSKNLTDFFCVATGAKNFTYGGKNMSDAHNPATNSRMTGKVSSTDFDNFMTDLVAGANKNNLPTYLITRVGTVTETTRAQVVQR